VRGGSCETYPQEIEINEMSVKMIIDSHAHIVSQDVKENIRRYSKRDRIFGPYLDLIYGRKKGKMVNAEELVDSMDQCGIKMTGVCTLPWSDQGLCADQNNYIIDSIAKYPARLFGFCCIQPKAGQTAVYEIERSIARGMKGVGELSAGTQGIDIGDRKLWMPILEIVKALQIPLLIHTNEPVGHYYPAKENTDLRKIYEFIKQFQGVDIILAHWGGGLFVYELMPEVKEEAKRVYYDTAASPLVFHPKIYYIAISIVGPEKILFGSDYPLLDQKRYLSEIQSSGLSQTYIEKIVGQNAKNLFGL
jgi:predicted TIM-barrel fold metal-dependent hydrolase